jgi:mono/diheme cytochrome c family protein
MRDPFNKTKRLTMPPFDGVLSPEQIRAVISYFKTLWTPDQRAFQAEESREQPFLTKSQ